MVEKNRIFGLDILRAFAILCVVFQHGQGLLGNGILSIQIKRISVHLFGYDGVSIFFVLSGFLIGGILIKVLDKKQTINRVILLQFWIRRWFRTLPNYFLILITLSILVYFNIGDCHGFDFSLWNIKKYFIFSQSLYKPHPNFFPEAWSLCVEEWFYLLIPLLIAIFIKLGKLSPKKSIFLSAIIVILAVIFFRYYKFTVISNSHFDWNLWFHKQVFTSLDSLMFGVIGAYINYYYHEKWIKHKKTLLVAGIFILTINKYLTAYRLIDFIGLYNTVFSLCVISIATLMCLPFFNGYKSGKGLVYKAITRISLISYSMYLLNLSFVNFSILHNIHFEKYSFIKEYHLINEAAFFKYILYWILVIVLSNLLYKYWEVPMMKLRDNRRIKSIFRI
ncbi:MAG: acyltransferase [Prevotellaceae bacterium]|jgi:peptidoglycan/LPS O-acetylase OafA/YrhL|nr:acyltransferase [Prevotellaceae bacterium]